MQRRRAGGVKAGGRAMSRRRDEATVVGDKEEKWRKRKRKILV
jgi:hypothetical protein